MCHFIAHEDHSTTNIMLAVKMEPLLRPIRSAMKPTLSMPKMMPAIWEYVREPRSLLLHCVCFFQHAGYAAANRAAHIMLVSIYPGARVLRIFERQLIGLWEDFADSRLRLPTEKMT